MLHKADPDQLETLNQRDTELKPNLSSTLKVPPKKTMQKIEFYGSFNPNESKG